MTDADLIRMRAELWCKVAVAVIGCETAKVHDAIGCAHEILDEFRAMYPLSTEKGEGKE